MFSKLLQGIKLGNGQMPADYRGDIDGLRAIAVLLVLGYHFFPWRMPGGFIGVDVFFVISGFLITRIILSDLDYGRFRVTRFFARRILRLFPALILILASLLVFGALAFASVEYEALGKELLSSVLFVPNFFFWSEAGYFADLAQSRPLLHLWSLGIEEQFYLVWPFVLLALGKAGRSALIIIGLMIVASFALNIHFLGAHNGFSFYMPFTRAWELLLGAILSFWRWQSIHHPDVTAMGKARASRSEWTCANIVHLVSRATPYAGLGMIATGAVLLNDQDPYPGAHALLPALGTCLIIAAPHETWLHRRVLSNPAVIWVGLISYPLYLWHWPLLSVSTLLDTQFPSRSVRVLLLALSVILAWLTCKYIERPVRRHASRATVLHLIAGMLILGGAGAVLYVTKGFPGRTDSVLAYEEKFGQFEFSTDPYSSELCRMAFPDNPDLGWCISGDNGKPSIALIGDSHAHHFFPGLAAAASARGESLVLLGSAACPPLFGVEVYEGHDDDYCAGLDSYLEQVARNETIHTVVLSAMWYLYMSGNRFYDELDSPPYWQVRETGATNVMSSSDVIARALEHTIRRFLDNDKQVLFIYQVPELDFHPKNCLARPMNFFEPRDCRIPFSRVRAYRQPYKMMLSSVLEKFAKVRAHDPVQQLCDTEYCIIYLGDKALYRDLNHLSLFGSKHLARNWFD